jgi:outer membrane protein TolC
MHTFERQRGWWLGALLLALAAGGCSRQYYRKQADADVYCLIGQKANDPRWNLTDYSIEPSPLSRMFDPTNPDCPPLPPDDPASHLLMHCVDGKRGYKHWHRNGDTPLVDNPTWKQHLPLNEEGVLALDRQLAMRVALINSRDYQTELEDLYLSALDVSFQRFRFDTQFFLANSTFYTNIGPEGAGGPSRELRSDTNLQARRLFATGGEMVVELANTLVWQFAGPDERQARSLLDFSLIQPLLRGAGRAVVLENLTDSERALLANVRQMERFRQGFYTNVIAGRAAGVGPNRGGFIVQSLAPSSAVGTGGLYTLLSDQVRIRNQRVNVSGLRESLDLIEAHYDAGRIDRLQLDVTRQALLNAQSRLLGLHTTYQDRLDAYKILLGLPPSLEVTVRDTMLDRLSLVDPEVIAIDEEVAELIGRLRSPEPPVGVDHRTVVGSIAEKMARLHALLDKDEKALDEALPQRRQALLRLATREEVERDEVDQRPYSVPLLERRAAELKKDFAALVGVVDQTVAELQAFSDSPDEAQPLLPLLIRVSNVILGVQLVEAAARLDAITLTPVDLESDEALRIACQNRLDWMNARAALVDAWRQIEVRANALKSDLDVVLSGDVHTVDNNPLRFRGATGRLRVGLQFDAPLTRFVERNLYREALINYQQARRAYTFYEDRVSQNLRSTLRTTQQAQLDFELRRMGVLVAISQVDIARERLSQPPKPAAGQAAPTSTFGATTARDLVQAYQGLINAQDNLLAAWVAYETDRLSLDFELGTMQLDHCGIWIDPGPIDYSKKGDASAHAERADGASPELEVVPIPDPLLAPPVPPRPI